MKKLLALVLSVSMVLCAVPTFVFADTTTQTPPTTETPQVKELTEANTTIEGIEKTAYKGEAITLDKLAVKYKETETSADVTLVKDTDYTVKYENNEDVGDAKVTIEGKGAYKGKFEKTFIIYNNVTEKDDVRVDIPNQKKDAVKLEGVTATMNGVPISSQHFTVKSDDNSTPGTKTAEVTFDTTYYPGALPMEVQYNVVADDIANTAIFLNDLNVKYVYDGKAKTPGITVRDGRVALVEGTDYKLSYENNVNAGKATIKITGLGLYAGTKTYDFDIEKAKLADTEVVWVKDAYTYTGSEIKPEADKDFKVYFGETELSKDLYIVKGYANNTAIGEATMTLAVAAKNTNFEGEKIVKFAIASKAAADLTVTLEKETYDYTGQPITPAVTVKDGDKTLVENTDYTLAYENNTNAGIAAVVLTGKGAYTGTKTVEFRIKGKPTIITTDQNSYTKYVPTSKPFNLNAKTTSDATGFTYTSSNTDVVSVDAAGLVTVTGTGKATVTIKTYGNKAYDPAEKIVTITVKPLKPVFSLSSPAKKQIKVLITKVEGATKYQVEYGRAGKYYKKTIKHLDNEFAKTSTKLTNRTSGKTYYVRVRAIKEMPDGTVVYGNWTARKSMKSK